MLQAHDVLPPEGYEQIRPRVRPIIARVRSARRIRLSDHIVALFENRDTVLYQIQEVLRCEGSGEGRIAQVLREYEAIVPDSNELKATLMIDAGTPVELRAVAEAIVRGDVHLVVGENRCRCEVAESAYNEADPVWYVRWRLRPEWIESLAEAQSVEIEIDAGEQAVVGRGLIDAAHLRDDLRLRSGQILGSSDAHGGGSGRTGTPTHAGVGGLAVVG